MNGAESLVRSLLASGVDTCFANPGTSEMHFVAALDSAPTMRAVLCLFEGVATGAADGYFRMVSAEGDAAPEDDSGLALLTDAVAAWTARTISRAGAAARRGP